MQATQGTEILKRARQGDSTATAKLVELVYDRLRRLARGYVRRNTPHGTLQATDIVHEAYLNLVDQTAVDCNDRTHFVAIAAHAMRQVLAGYARRRGAQKRGGHWKRVPLRDTLALSETPDLDVLALDEALSALEELHERQARVVELRFFGGLDFKEIGGTLGISPRTAEADWYAGRAWLHRELGRE
jgi:RNA polymerase sigma factor (TIGR02999 family)